MADSNLLTGTYNPGYESMGSAPGVEIRYVGDVSHEKVEFANPRGAEFGTGDVTVNYSLAKGQADFTVRIFTDFFAGNTPIDIAVGQLENKDHFPTARVMMCDFSDTQWYNHGMYIETDGKVNIDVPARLTIPAGTYEGSFPLRWVDTADPDTVIQSEVIRNWEDVDGLTFRNDFSDFRDNRIVVPDIDMKGYQEIRVTVRFGPWKDVKNRNQEHIQGTKILVFDKYDLPTSESTDIHVVADVISTVFKKEWAEWLVVFHYIAVFILEFALITDLTILLGVLISALVDGIRLIMAMSAAADMEALTDVVMGVVDANEITGASTTGPMNAMMHAGAVETLDELGELELMDLGQGSPPSRVSAPERFVQVARGNPSTRLNPMAAENFLFTRARVDPDAWMHGPMPGDPDYVPGPGDPDYNPFGQPDTLDRLFPQQQSAPPVRVARTAIMENSAAREAIFRTMEQDENAIRSMFGEGYRDSMYEVRAVQRNMIIGPRGGYNFDPVPGPRLIEEEVNPRWWRQATKAERTEWRRAFNAAQNSFSRELNNEMGNWLSIMSDGQPMSEASLEALNEAFEQSWGHFDSLMHTTWNYRWLYEVSPRVYNEYALMMARFREYSEILRIEMMVHWEWFPDLTVLRSMLPVIPT